MKNVSTLEQFAASAANKTHDAAEQVGHKIDHAQYRAQSAMAHTADTLRDAVDHTESKARAVLGNIASKTANAVDSVAATGNIAQAKLRNSSKQALESCQTYIENNPMRSALIAAGLGAVAALALRSVAQRRLY